MSNLVDYTEMVEGNSIGKSKRTIARYNVAAVIMNNHDEVLLCKRSMSKRIAPGNWNLPGGKIDDGETVDAAIARELAEELSVIVVDIRQTPVIFTYAVGEEVHQTYFSKVTICGSIILNFENDAHLYVHTVDISRYLPKEWCDEFYFKKFEKC